MKYIILGIVIIIIILIVLVRNKFVLLNNNMEESFSNIDIQLKKRFDLIPNLVETVKKYMEHEKNTLEEIVQLRNNHYDKLSISDKVKLDNELNDSLNAINVLVENYPELKASDNFIELQKELAKIENEIADKRILFNNAVKKYNDSVIVFPNSVVALIFGYKAIDYFEVKEKEKENIKVQF